MRMRFHSGLKGDTGSMSYFGGPALIHQVDVLVSPNAKQPQTCWLVEHLVKLKHASGTGLSNIFQVEPLKLSKKKKKKRHQASVVMVTLAISAERMHKSHTRCQSRSPDTHIHTQRQCQSVHHHERRQDSRLLSYKWEKTVSPKPTVSPPPARAAQLRHRPSKMCWHGRQCKLGPARHVHIFALITQQNSAHRSHYFTETQHTNIRPHKTLSRSLSLFPSTHFSMTHFQKSSEEIRGERRAPLRARQPTGSLLSPQHEGPVRAWMRSSTGQSQSLFHTGGEGQSMLRLSSRLTPSFDPILIWVCDHSQGTQRLHDPVT